MKERSKRMGKQKKDKVYKTSYLANLLINNPSKYAKLNDEILKAYAEGRVIDDIQDTYIELWKDQPSVPDKIFFDLLKL
jgi:hypothetical protein